MVFDLANMHGGRSNHISILALGVILYLTRGFMRRQRDRGKNLLFFPLPNLSIVPCGDPYSSNTPQHVIIIIIFVAIGIFIQVPLVKVSVQRIMNSIYISIYY